MKRFFELVVNHPRTTLILVLVVTIFFLFQIPRIPIETDLKRWLPEGHPEVEYYEQVRDRFDLSSQGVIAVSDEAPEGVFNPVALKLVAELTEKVKEMDGVIEDDVISISTQDNIVGTPEGFEVIPFMEDIPETQEEAEALRDAIHGNDMYYGTLVSKDDKGTLILVKVADGLDKVTLYHQMRGLVETERNLYPEQGIYYAGRPILEGVLREEVIEDMRVMLPIVIAVVIVLLALTMRTVRGVVLPFLTVLISGIWTLGVMALIQSPLYSMSTMIPVILIAIGCADGIHIITRYYEAVGEDESRPRREIVMEAMMEMRVPVVMTSLTTMVGFLSMTVSHSLPPRSVGFFTALGVTAAGLISLTLIPAGLVLLRPVRPKALIPFWTESESNLLDGVFSHLGRTIYRGRKSVFAAAVVAAIVSALGSTRVYIHEGLTANMQPDSETIRADTFLNEKFGGTVTINVVLEGAEADSIKSPELMHRMDALQSYAEQHPLVGDSLSIAEYLKRMNKVMNEDKENFNRVPDSRDLIAQYLLLYSISGDPDDFDNVVDYEYKNANVSVQMKSDAGEDIANVFSYLAPRVNELFDDLPLKSALTGRAKMTLLVVDNVIRDQLQSFVVAIIAVFIITSMMFRSVRIGLIAIVPISIASIANFGLMGLLGMPLQVATTFSACVGIGIGIDYTIHFFAKYRRLTAKGLMGAEANVQTMQTSGRAIFYNAVVVAFGFLVLIWSNSPPNRNMGILVSLNMATSFLGAMTVLPCILNLVKPETILGGPLRESAGEES
jgi:predicted RND superfamily exporter protein